jgi:hypothetical protein
MKNSIVDASADMYELLFLSLPMISGNLGCPDTQIREYYEF